MGADGDVAHLVRRAALSALIALATPAGVSGQNEKESFTGFAINMNSGPSTAVIDFTIERWSTDAEREQLLSILTEENDSYRANDKKTDNLVLENFGQQPIRFNEIKKVK